MNELPAKSIAYMPQLDGIRAFAIISVILSHWFAPFTTSGYLPYGELGVVLFFVLSGFLITRILLNYKSGISENKERPGYYLKKFFLRRVIRIFPVYYITIALISIFKPSIFEGGVLWHCFYLSNFYFVLIKQGWQQPISQWWSLSVEEQFYTVWPFFILFVNRKYLAYGILAIIFVAPVFRQLYSVNNYLYQYLTPGCFDSLGFGALLALHHKKFSSLISTASVNILLVVFFIIIIFFTRFKFPFSYGLDRFYLSVFSLLVIYRASVGFTGISGHVLTNPVIIYIGKISYGLYVYHKLIPELDLHINTPILLQTMRIVVLLILASASYFFMERPILNLKKYA